MIRFTSGLACAVCLSVGSVAAADQPQPLPSNPPSWPSPEAEAKLRGAIDQMVDAFQLLLRDVPRYAPPEINQNGDIILRRLNPPDERLPTRPDRRPPSLEDKT